MRNEPEKRVLIDMLYGTDRPEFLEDKFNRLVMAIRQIQNILIAEKKMKP